MLNKYVKQRRLAILAFLLFYVIFFASFYLYHLPMAAVIYPGIVCAVIAILLFAADYAKARSRHRQLEAMKKLSAELLCGLPPAESLEDEDYQAIISMLCEENARTREESSRRYSDMTDYYTVWVHQIKTPISSMRLKLQTEDSAMSRKLSADLSRIEQYVEMVLAFLRLDSETTDYVFRECELDDIIRQSVKKFSEEFIGRKLSLSYEPVNVSLLTDEKWLCFVLEQLLSNALKYTREGGVTIGMEGERRLFIRDTGMGIAPEDMPRIFDKGYTGFNGREDKKASGLGLYLCRRICDNLGVGISAESKPDEGTAVFLDFPEKRERHE